MSRSVPYSAVMPQIKLTSALWSQSISLKTIGSPIRAWWRPDQWTIGLPPKLTKTCITWQSTRKNWAGCWFPFLAPCFSNIYTPFDRDGSLLLICNDEYLIENKLRRQRVKRRCWECIHMLKAQPINDNTISFVIRNESDAPITDLWSQFATRANCAIRRNEATSSPASAAKHQCNHAVRLQRCMERLKRCKAQK